MPPEARDLGYLWDMLDAARMAEQLGRGVTFAEYTADRMRQLAVERAVEIIGEAARRTSASLRAAHPDIPWAPIIAQRHVLAHEYGGIRLDLMWRIVTEHAPALVRQLVEKFPELDGARP
jgi:uncharacterized protein with HEPN domain